MTDDVEGKPPPGIPPTAPPPSADPPGGAPPPPPWVRPGRTAPTPVRPAVLVGAIIAAVLVVIVTVAIVGNTGSHPVAAASPSTTPTASAPPLPPNPPASGPTAGATSPRNPATNAVGGLDPSQVFAGQIAPDGHVLLDQVMVHHGEGCAVHIDNSGVRDTFQHWNCGSVISATYATADHQVLVGALVFPFPDVASAAAAAGSVDPEREAQARAFAPLNPSPGPGRMPVPRLAVQTNGSYLVVIVAWYQDGRNGSQSDDQLSLDSAPLLVDIGNHLAALPS